MTPGDDAGSWETLSSGASQYCNIVSVTAEVAPDFGARGKLLADVA